jgi:hypothetical protein
MAKKDIMTEAIMRMLYLMMVTMRQRLGRINVEGLGNLV